MTRGTRELIDAGFSAVCELTSRPKLGDALFGPFRPRGKWFTAVDTTQHAQVLFLRQQAHIWHAFGESVWTGSGSNPKRAMCGGLGDVIGTDGEMRSYALYVKRAPLSWSERFHGLMAAKGQVN